jgi:hypothetical protein
VCRISVCSLLFCFVSVPSLSVLLSLPFDVAARLSRIVLAAASVALSALSLFSLSGLRTPFSFFFFLESVIFLVIHGVI